MGNIVRRILRLIREEWFAATTKNEEDREDGGEEENSTRPHSPDLPSGAQSSNAEFIGSPVSMSTSISLNVIPPLAREGSQYSLTNFVLHGKPHRESSHQISFDPQRGAPPSSLLHSAIASAQGAQKPPKKANTIKPALIQAIQEVLDDLETVFENVSKNARDHIHSE